MTAISLSLAMALTATLAVAGSASAQTATSPASAPAAPANMAAMTRASVPQGAKIGFVGIKEGDTVASPFKIGFAAEGIKVAPAGTTTPGTGHFHLLIDTDLPPQDAPLPANDHVKHFGKGQTDTDVTLPAGKHTLQLEMTDGNHLPFAPPLLSAKISVTVK
jgi:hypothetical protein